MKHTSSVKLTALFVLCALLLPCLSCARASGTGESRAVSLTGFIDRVTAPDGTEYSVESFTFMERSNPDYEKSPIVEKTGYRIIARDPATGETVTPCKDPLCTHDCLSGCPLASRTGITYPELCGGCLLFRCSEAHKMICFDLSTGVSDVVYEFDTNWTPGAMPGESCVFYVGPELEGEKTVFPLVRYDVADGKRTVLATFQDRMTVCLVTDKRVYVGKHMSVCFYPEDAGVVSFTYNGTDRRDEPAFFEKVALRCGGFIIANEPAFQTSLGLGSWPRYIVYDIKTRKTVKIPEEGWASSVGYNPNDGRIYYLCSPAAFTVLGRSHESYAAELGITYAQFIADMELMQQYGDEFTAAIKCGEKTLRSCLPDGSDERIEFEFTEGSFFFSCDSQSPPQYMPARATGSISSDGKYYYFKEYIDRGNPQVEYRHGSIDLETGEIKYEGE